MPVTFGGKNAAPVTSVLFCTHCRSIGSERFSGTAVAPGQKMSVGVPSGAMVAPPLQELTLWLGSTPSRVQLIRSCETKWYLRHASSSRPLRLQCQQH